MSAREALYEAIADALLTSQPFPHMNPNDSLMDLWPDEVYGPLPAQYLADSVFEALAKAGFELVASGGAS